MSLLKIDGPKKEAIQEAKQAILEIVSSHADQKTIRLALEVLSSALSPLVNISGCTFSGCENCQDEKND